MISVDLNLIAGWLGILGGILSGAIIGLFFHTEGWLGGYGSHARRLVRLGHISFFGLGLLNLLFALSVPLMHVPLQYVAVGSIAFVTAEVTMPICCFLTAWRKGCRHLFPFPVTAAAIGVITLLAGAFRI
jgi:hypothetical protein